jgi:hypothetical protein
MEKLLIGPDALLIRPENKQDAGIFLDARRNIRHVVEQYTDCGELRCGPHACASPKLEDSHSPELDECRCG